MAGRRAGNKTYKKIAIPATFLIVAFALVLTVLDMTGIFSVRKIGGESAVPVGDAVIQVIDCGQGDSILIQLSDKTVLIDGTTGKDAGKVLAYLDKQGVKKLDLVIATHAHEDHIGGLDDVLRAFPVEQVIMTKLTGSLVPTTKAYENFLMAVKENGCRVTPAKPGDEYVIGDGKFTILGPLGTPKDLNNTSVVVKLDVGAGTALFMGDAEKEQEDLLEKEWYSAIQNIDVLKVGHHGSSTSSSDDFLRLVKPKYAAISCGKGNDYGHPDADVLKNLKKYDVTVGRTDTDGTLVYRLTSSGFSPD